MLMERKYFSERSQRRDVANTRECNFRYEPPEDIRDREDFYESLCLGALAAGPLVVAAAALSLCSR